MDFYMSEDTMQLRRTVRWTVNVVLVPVGTQLLVYGFCAQVPVSDGSIRSVLNTDDVALVSRLIYDAGKPEWFNIVISEHEDYEKSVKRIIGLPGETVQIRSGHIFIDGGLLSVEDGLEQVSLARRADTPIKLEDNEYFLLGDNRDSSEGSRSPDIGNVKREQIRDKIRFKIFPLLKLDFIHSRWDRSLRI